jgi:hypothetical protein
VSVTSGVCNNHPLLDCHVIMRRRHVVLGHYWWFVTLWSRWSNARAITGISYTQFIFTNELDYHTQLNVKSASTFILSVNVDHMLTDGWYMEYVSKIIRYSRACGSYHDFRDKMLLLTQKLLNQGFHIVKLKSAVRNVHGHHGYVSFVVIKSMSFSSSWLAIKFVITVARQVSLVEQELLKLPEHRLHPIF